MLSVPSAYQSGSGGGMGNSLGAPSSPNVPTREPSAVSPAMLVRVAPSPSNASQQQTAPSLLQPNRQRSSSFNRNSPFKIQQVVIGGPQSRAALEGVAVGVGSAGIVGTTITSVGSPTSPFAPSSPTSGLQKKSGGAIDASASLRQPSMQPLTMAGQLHRESSSLSLSLSGSLQKGGGGGGGLLDSGGSMSQSRDGGGGGGFGMLGNGSISLNAANHTSQQHLTTAATTAAATGGNLPRVMSYLVGFKDAISSMRHDDDDILPKSTRMAADAFYASGGGGVGSEERGGTATMQPTAATREQATAPPTAQEFFETQQRQQNQHNTNRESMSTSIEAPRRSKQYRQTHSNPPPPAGTANDGIGGLMMMESDGSSSSASLSSSSSSDDDEGIFLKIQPAVKKKKGKHGQHHKQKKANSNVGKPPRDTNTKRRSTTTTTDAYKGGIGGGVGGSSDQYGASSSTYDDSLFGRKLLSFHTDGGASSIGDVGGALPPMNPKDFTDLLEISIAARRKAFDEDNSKQLAKDREAQFQRYKQRRANYWAHKEVLDERAAKPVEPTQEQISAAVKEQRSRESRNLIEIRRKELEDKVLLTMPMLDRIALCLSRPQVPVATTLGAQQEQEGDDSEEEGSSRRRRGRGPSGAGNDSQEAREKRREREAKEEEEEERRKAREGGFARLLDIDLDDDGLYADAEELAKGIGAGGQGEADLARLRRRRASRRNTSRDGENDAQQTRRFGKVKMRDADDVNQKYEAHMTANDLKQQMVALGYSVPLLPPSAANASSMPSKRASSNANGEKSMNAHDDDHHNATQRRSLLPDFPHVPHESLETITAIQKDFEAQLDATHRPPTTELLLLPTPLDSTALRTPLPSSTSSTSPMMPPPLGALGAAVGNAAAASTTAPPLSSPPASSSRSHTLQRSPCSGSPQYSARGPSSPLSAFVEGRRQLRNTHINDTVSLSLSARSGNTTTTAVTAFAETEEGGQHHSNNDYADYEYDEETNYLGMGVSKRTYMRMSPFARKQMREMSQAIAEQRQARLATDAYQAQLATLPVLMPDGTVQMQCMRAPTKQGAGEANFEALTSHVTSSIGIVPPSFSAASTSTVISKVSATAAAAAAARSGVALPPLSRTPSFIASTLGKGGNTNGNNGHHGSVSTNISNFMNTIGSPSSPPRPEKPRSASKYDERLVLFKAGAQKGGNNNNNNGPSPDKVKNGHSPSSLLHPNSSSASHGGGDDEELFEGTVLTLELPSPDVKASARPPSTNAPGRPQVTPFAAYTTAIGEQQNAVIQQFGAAGGGTGVGLSGERGIAVGSSGSGHNPYAFSPSRANRLAPINNNGGGGGSTADASANTSTNRTSASNAAALRKAAPGRSIVDMMRKEKGGGGGGVTNVIDTSAASDNFLSNESDKAFLWTFELESIHHEAVEKVIETHHALQQQQEHQHALTNNQLGGGAIITSPTAATLNFTFEGGGGAGITSPPILAMNPPPTNSRGKGKGGGGTTMTAYDDGVFRINVCGVDDSGVFNSSPSSANLAQSSHGSLYGTPSGVNERLTFMIPSTTVVLPSKVKTETQTQALRRKLHALVLEQHLQEQQREEEANKNTIDASSSVREKMERVVGSVVASSKAKGGLSRRLQATRARRGSTDANASAANPPDLAHFQSSASLLSGLSSHSLRGGNGASPLNGRTVSSLSDGDFRQNGGGAGGGANGYRRRLYGAGRFCEWTETPFISAHAGFADEQELAHTSEESTNIPAQDLHLYSLYCWHTKTTIMIRPVSHSALDIYAGTAMVSKAICDADGVPMPRDDLDWDEIEAYTTYECRVKGKSISVSLKSSPYPPIDGLIPVNPALGKAYLDAMKRARELDDMILNANVNVVPMQLMRKREAQKAQAQSATAAFIRDIHVSLAESNAKCAELLRQYKQEVVATTDKASVSKRYIDVLNNAQFLGTKRALWRGLEIYYNDLGVGGVERVTEEGAPCFYIKKDGRFYSYNQKSFDMESTPVTAAVEKNLKPVEVVSHRQFFVSPVTKRIEEDLDSFLIGPDFDGLSYAKNIYYVNSTGRFAGKRTPYSTEDHIQFALQRTHVRLEPGMGIINPMDYDHIKDMRELTGWKQNHGYECNNTVKSQTLTPGPYVVITPTNVRVLNTFEEVIGYYRWAWLDGTPLPLSPNWRVALRNGLPCPLGEDVSSPIVDDCGSQQLEFELETKVAKGSVPPTMTLETLKASYVPMAVRAEKQKSQQMSGVHKTAKAAAHSDVSYLHDEYTLMRDKKEVASAFYVLRRWQLLPPLFRFDEEAAANAAAMLAAGTSITTTAQTSMTAMPSPHHGAGGHSNNNGPPLIKNFLFADKATAKAMRRNKRREQQRQQQEREQAYLLQQLSSGDGGGNLLGGSSHQLLASGSTSRLLSKHGSALLSPTRSFNGRGGGESEAEDDDDDYEEGEGDDDDGGGGDGNSNNHDGNGNKNTNSNANNANNKANKKGSTTNGIELVIRSSEEARDEYAMDEGFELYRMQQMDVAAQHFLELCDLYEYLHPSTSKHENFILHLKSYVWSDYEDLPNLTSSSFTSHADLLL